MNLKANLHSLLSFAWTLTRPTNFNLLRQNIVFSYSQRKSVSFSWLIDYFSFFFCYFTLLLIFTKIILLLLFYHIFFSWKLFLFFHVPGYSGMFRNVPACSGMFRVPGFIDGLFSRTVEVTFTRMFNRKATVSNGDKRHGVQSSMISHKHTEVCTRKCCQLQIITRKLKWFWNTITKKLQQTYITFFLQILYHTQNRDKEWMLHKDFKRRENRTLLKRFVLRTTEFHQHMAKSTTTY